MSCGRNSSGHRHGHGHNRRCRILYMPPLSGTSHGLLRRVDAGDALFLAAQAAVRLLGTGDLAESYKVNVIRTKVSGSPGPLPKTGLGSVPSHGDSRHSSQARCFCGPAGAARALPGAMAETSREREASTRRVQDAVRLWVWDICDWT